jgi:hypothetical protein
LEITEYVISMLTSAALVIIERHPGVSDITHLIIEEELEFKVNMLEVATAIIRACHEIIRPRHNFIYE